MDVTGWLLRRAVPRAFVVTAVGGTGARLAVEAELRERGWYEAASPAEADMLVACGHPCAELSPVLDRVWDQMPGPRVRAAAAAPERAAGVLDRARAELLDTAAQRRDAEERDGAARGRAREEGGEDMPGGLPMADRGEDRDGLTLDRLHVSLGPALPAWPAGLSLSTVVQGDVVQEARVRLVGAREGGSSSFWEGKPARAASLDAAQNLLAVAGWPAAALEGRRLRDALLRGEDGPRTRERLRRWTLRVRRSRLLRWATAGLGEADGRAPAGLRGDVADRWSRWLDPDGGFPPYRADASRAALDLLPGLVIGQELAAVRLIVASLAPDTGAVGAYAPGGSA
ncbi:MULTISPECIES: hypothetical protein [unclassified Nocardiopsis]|uniref:hypothetical protein n=1 Tax=unclassified Nocardiopsis TaxID=2649073 RepID=UPI00135B8E57|nr:MULTISPECIES: hypothetical protein [unclassified Nocardiopsis]